MNLKGQVVRNDLELETVHIEPLNTPSYGIFNKYLNVVPTKKNFVKLNIVVELFELVGNADEALALLNIKVKDSINLMLRNHEKQVAVYTSQTIPELQYEAELLRTKLELACKELNRAELCCKQLRRDVNAK